MKPLFFLCLTCCLLGTSCERHVELQREITALNTSFKRDEAAAQQYEKDIAALGGKDALARINAQIQTWQYKMSPLEFANGPRERRLSAIETEFARLGPIAEAYKAAQPK